jgi:xanthine dehydrogenase accessory factor
MNDNEYIAKTVCERLGEGVALVLVSIISLQGSAPRHGGSKMLVDAGGKSYGTIGGSLLEAAAINEAGAVLGQERSRLMHFDFTGESGMICGGRAVLLLDYLPATEENLSFFRRWYEAVREGRDCCFLTAFKDRDGGVEVVGHGLCGADGEAVGDYAWAKQETEKLRAALCGATAAALLALDDDTRVFVDPVRKARTLYCFGAGHVAVPTAHLAAMAGFRVVVVDDRAEFASAGRFPEAAEVIVTGDFGSALEGLEIDGDSFIVIVTREHRYDRVVLEQALKTEAGYIGMISSRKKRETIYAALMEEGVARQELDAVHSPIGLAIGAETPEEIAVSIVAELISERSKLSE